MPKVALITGLTGQDGAYLAKLLLDFREEDYEGGGELQRGVPLRQEEEEEKVGGVTRTTHASGREGKG